VSEAWGLRKTRWQRDGVGVPITTSTPADLFVTNDLYYNYLFHNAGGKFEEVALEKGVALVEDGQFISGMGVDFRDIDNDGYPDITTVALNNQTFPIWRNIQGKSFEEITGSSGMRQASLHMGGFGPGFFDFDNDGWKDLFVSCGHVEALPKPGTEIAQHNMVFPQPRRKRPLASGRRGRVDRGSASAASWMRLCRLRRRRKNGCRSNSAARAGRDLDEPYRRRGTLAGYRIGRNQKQSRWNRRGGESSHQGGHAVQPYDSSVGYASSSHGPVHFGLGEEKRAELAEIRWPSGRVQALRNLDADRVLTVKEPVG